MFYTLSHAALPLLLLQIYRTGIIFIYTESLVGTDGMRVRLSAHKSGFAPMFCR